MAKSPLATLKYFSTLLVCALALAAGWWLWNYYMQGPWTRDGKVRAELVSVTPEASSNSVLNSGSPQAGIVPNSPPSAAGPLLGQPAE